MNSVFPAPLLIEKSPSCIMSIPISRSISLTKLQTVTLEFLTISAMLILFMPLTLTRLKGTKFKLWAISGVIADNIAPVSHNALTLILLGDCDTSYISTSDVSLNER